MFDWLLKPQYRMELYKKITAGYDETGAEMYQYELVKTVPINIAETRKTVGLIDFKYLPKEVSRTKGLKRYICKDIDNGDSVLLMGTASYNQDTTEINSKDKKKIFQEGLHGGIPINTITLIAIAGLCLVIGLMIGYFAPQITGAF